MPRSKSAWHASTRPSQASAAAPTRRVRAAMPRPKISPSCSPACASKPASTCRHCSRCAPRWPSGCKAKRCTARCGWPDFPRRCQPPEAPQSRREQTMKPSANAQNSLPLTGIRVIEFTHMVMGPTCGMILADLGAEVIKIEPPGGDKTRKLPGLGIGFFRTFNRNKKSVVLDIKQPAAKETIYAMLADCDVVLENFRPGLMTELGLDYEALAQRFPKLIYVSHKGFLPGPYDHRTALDEVVQMMGGLSYMTGPPGRPLRAGTSVNDIMGGMFGAIGVLAALLERNRTGRGQEIQSALYENCVFLNAQHMQQFAMTNEPPPPMPARVSAWSVYDIFTLADDEQLFIAAVSDSHWWTLCKVLESTELANDEDLKTNAPRLDVRPELLKR